MSQNRTLAISQAMRDSIVIKKFIYHILLTENEEVDYLTAVELTDEHKAFFQEMIAEASRGTKYRFVDPENSFLPPVCRHLLDNIDNDDIFVDSSQQIANNFKTQHDNRMADGIVIITAFTMVVNMQPSNFIAILKLDYKPVLQQVREEDDPTHVSFQKITDSLLEDKSAIQKRVIIDIDDSFEWDAIAVERGKSAADLDTDVAIGSHFQKFLNVALLGDNSALTRKVITQSKKWASQHAELVPSDIKSRVINFLGAHNDQSVNLDDIKEIVCCHVDEEVGSRLERHFDEFMDSVDLSGVDFIAKANSIPDRERRTKVKTNLSVTLEWTGEMADSGIEREIVDGKTIFTIKADHVNETG